MCEKDEPVTLKAYPGGGIWFGNGIADANAGIFDPSLIPGKSSFISYKVDDCDASNRIVIRVIEHVKPFQLQDADSAFFCGRIRLCLPEYSAVRININGNFRPHPEIFHQLRGLIQNPFIQQKSRVTIN
ncbi:MAG: hypothetical protein MUC73_11075 [Cyclobacteriaceae bacterium]|nr:hypothetical protein [Cyclobacteriaceae bacterium]